MIEQLKNELEIIFRDSTSSGELFDAFSKAIKYKIKDAELYKILLANMSLTPDELKMYAEKLCTEFTDLAYDIYLWTAGILESLSSFSELDAAFEYYNKAIKANKQECTPYLYLIKMYNPDFDYPSKEALINLFRTGISDVKSKSKLCTGISEFYAKIQNENLRRKYLALAANYARSKQ